MSITLTSVRMRNCFSNVVHINFVLAYHNTGRLYNVELFLPLQPVLHSLTSDLRMGYLDDLSLGGSPDIVAKDIETLASLNSSLGLNLNLNKCEFYSPSVMASNYPSFSEFQCVDFESLTLLGAALFKGSALDSMLQAHCKALESAIDDLCQLPAQS